MFKATMRNLKKAALLVILIPLLSQYSLGQGLRRPDPDKWEFSLFGGYGSLGGRSEFLTQVGDTDSNLVQLDSGSGWVLGVRIAENLGGFFAAEFEYSIADQPMTALNLAPEIPILPLDQKVHDLSYNGIFYPFGRTGSIRPFGTIGAGASLFQISSEAEATGIANGLDLVNRWKLAITWGAGVKFRMRGPWGLRLDFRDHISPVPDYGISRQAQLVSGVITPAFRPDGNFHRYQFTAGFIYFFQP